MPDPLRSGPGTALVLAGIRSSDPVATLAPCLAVQSVSVAGADDASGEWAGEMLCARQRGNET